MFRIDFFPLEMLTLIALQTKEEFARKEASKEAELEYRPSKSSIRSAGVQAHFRLPHIRFAAKLERLLMNEWRKPSALEFRSPVPATLSRYHAMIKNPICLSDIRDRIGEREN